MRIIPVFCALLLMAAPATAAVKSVTFYLDGARVEREATATRGYLEIPLPSGMEAGSLRVRPLQGATLSRVEVVPARPNPKLERELALFTERKDSIADRLKALDVREEIFKAADGALRRAKSEGGDRQAQKEMLHGGVAGYGNELQLIRRNAGPVEEFPGQSLQRLIDKILQRLQGFG